MPKYQHKRDLENLDDFRVDFQPINKLMVSAVNRTKIAIQDLPDSQGGFTTLVAGMLQLFLTTHGSVVVLADKSFSSPRMAGDAISLVREQVEKIFQLTLLLNDPEKGMKLFLRNGWKSGYEDFLLKKVEAKKLPRFKDYLKSGAPQEFEKRRYLPKLNGKRREVLVTKQEQRAITFKFNNPYAPLPKYLRKVDLKNRFDFPGPGKVRDAFRKDPDTWEYLERWHKEYKQLCAYTHVLFGKLIVPSMVEMRDIFEQSQVEEVVHRKVSDAIMIDVIATACGCTEALKLLTPNAHILGALTSLWEAMRKASLVAEVFWNLRAKNLFPPSII